MKTLITLLISILSLSLAAQNVTVTFAGANKNRNYQVVIDGISYYSANNESSNGRTVVTIPNLAPGAHNLDVYVLGNNNTTYSDGSANSSVQGEPAYSKTFQLRQGYDMNLSVRGNGLVSFTERKSKTQYNAQTGGAMSTTAFNQLVQNVLNKRYQSDKIIAVRNAFNTTGNYFTSAQARQLLLMINSERRRLELAKLSYSKVTDKTNFTTVYNVLNSEASRDALDDYVVAQGGSISSTENNTAYGNNPAYGSPMTDANFNQLLSRTTNYLYQDDRLTEIRNAFNTTGNYFTSVQARQLLLMINSERRRLELAKLSYSKVTDKTNFTTVYNYFNTTQIKQLLTLINAETDRLSLAKLAFARVVDRNNFNQVVDLFYSQYNRDELNRFIINNGGVANTTTFKAPMTDASFTQIYNKARAHFFQKNTLNDIRNAFNNTGNNFSTAQVKQLLMLANTEPDKLALAKLAYPRVVDPVNFSQLLDLFSVQSNRTELDIFIKAQVY
jgi:hypothetical protein